MNREEEPVSRFSECAEIAERLVEFADGELGAEEAAQVAAHVKECAACRRDVAALSHSLELARVEWSMPQVSSFAPRKNALSRSERRLYAAAARALAAGLFIAACGGAWWFLGPPGSPAVVAVRPVADAAVAEAASFGSPADMAVFEAELHREAAAARLVASADVLANQPGAEAYAERSLRFVAEVFPNTAAGSEAARRLSALVPDRSPTLPN